MGLGPCLAVWSPPRESCWHSSAFVRVLPVGWCMRVLLAESSAEKDWEDIKFGVEHAVDFYALSFVKDAQVVLELKDFLRGQPMLLG